jgi:methylated-DNA-protein-cysteine methyltransferase-like protein
MVQSTFNRVYRIVAKIPKGKVSTYKQIAKLTGIKNPRVVGWALRINKNPKVPCYRVIKKDGTMAEKFSRGGWKGQRKILKKEGITFVSKRQVNLNKHFWKG